MKNELVGGGHSNPAEPLCRCSLYIRKRIYKTLALLDFSFLKVALKVGWHEKSNSRVEIGVCVLFGASYLLHYSNGKPVYADTIFCPFHNLNLMVIEIRKKNLAWLYLMALLHQRYLLCDLEW